MSDEEEQPEEAPDESVDDNEDAGGSEDDEDAEGDGEDKEGGGLNAKKIILFVVVPLVLLGAIGGGLYFTGMLDGLLGKGGEEVALLDEHGEPVLDEHGEPVMVAKEEDGHEGDDKHAKKKGGDHGGGHGEEGGGGFVEIPTMIVNLNSEDGTPRYLRLTVQLELEDPGDVEAINTVIPRVVDQFQTYLRELRVKDLRGSAGIYRLQMELLWRVNQASDPVKVKDVLFQEILIQ